MLIVDYFFIAVDIGIIVDPDCVISVSSGFACFEVAAWCCKTGWSES